MYRYDFENHSLFHLIFGVKIIKKHYIQIICILYIEYNRKNNNCLQHFIYLSIYF